MAFRMKMEGGSSARVTALLRQKSWQLIVMNRLVGKKKERKQIRQDADPVNNASTNVDVRAELKALQQENQSAGCPRYSGRSRYTFTTGDTYDGEWAKGTMHGQGTYTYANTGNQFSGNWHDNKRHGFGTFINKVKNTMYEGEWKEDVRFGTGKFTDEEGNEYRGEWKKGKMCGQGTYTFVNGDVFEGNFQGGDFNGYGVFSYANNDKYEGEWRDGMQHGTGSFFYADQGHKFEGEWVNDCKHGHGKYTSPDFEYHGEWREDAMCGKGTYVYNSGDKFSGEWQDDHEHGYGVYTGVDGTRYEGNWKRGMRGGKGTYVMADGTKYEGEWLRNKKHGIGVLHYPSGAKYEGEFVGDVPHGQGVYVYSSGKKFKVEYNDGKCVHKTPQADDAGRTSSRGSHKEDKKTSLPSIPTGNSPRPTSRDANPGESNEKRASHLVDEARRNVLSMMNLMEAPDDMDPVSVDAARDCRDGIVKIMQASDVSSGTKGDLKDLLDQLEELLGLAEAHSQILEEKRKEEEARRRKLEEEIVKQKENEVARKREQEKKEAREKIERLKAAQEQKRKEAERAKNADASAQEELDKRREEERKEREESVAYRQHLALEKELKDLKLELATRPTDEMLELRKAIELEARGVKEAELRAELERERLEEAEAQRQEDELKAQIEAELAKDMEAEVRAKMQVEMKGHLERQKTAREKELKERERKAAEAAASDALAAAMAEHGDGGPTDEELETIKREAEAKVKKEFDKKLRALENEVAEAKAEASRPDPKMQAELEKARTLYEREAAERKKIHNDLVNAKGAIRVFVRVKESPGEDHLKYPESETIVCAGADKKIKSYDFDRVWAPGAGTQAEVFEECQPVIQSVADGYNVTIFTFGETGSGKTHTAIGPPGERGLASRTCAELFRCLDGRKETMGGTLKVSFVELVGDGITDLLTGEGGKRVKNDREEGSIVDCSTAPLDAPEALEDHLSTAEGNRTDPVGGTLVMTLHGHFEHFEKKEKYHAKLQVIDLCGAEKTGSPDSLKTCQVLGEIMMGVTNKSKGIAYQKCMLTNLLSDALGGKAKAMMYCTLLSGNQAENPGYLLYCARAVGLEAPPKKGKG